MPQLPANEGGGSLTAADIRLLREMMVEVSAETAARHVCRFKTIPDADAQEMGHAVGMLSDVGSGELRAGIELVRENHKWIRSLRERCDKLNLAASVAALGVFVSALLATVWVGIKNHLAK